MSIATPAIIAAAALALQGTGGSPPVASERATLLQLSVAIPPTGAAELGRAVVEETAKITSCADGLKLVDRLKARALHGSLSFTVRPDVPIAALPAPLRDALLARPVGRATPVFGGSEAFRVLIRCEPSFVVPRRAPASPAERRRTSGSI